MRKKAQENIVLRDKHNHLNLLLIVSVAIGGSRGDPGYENAGYK